MKKRLVVLLLHCFILVILLFAWAKPTWAGKAIVKPPENSNIGPWFSQSVEQYDAKIVENVTTPTPSVEGDLWIGSFAPGSIINGLRNYAIGNIYINNAAGSVKGATTGMRPGGAAGFIASGIDIMIENKPASSVDYIAYMGSQLRVPGTPEVAYAAGGGLGFNGLTPVLNIWVMMRNLAYFLFAIIFVVIGIMIMTRRKIDPKTVASIQNALPKIIFALIIVTFSYAIAGFLVDLMYVALALIVTLMNSLQGGSGKFVEDLLSGSIFNFVLNREKGLFGVSASIAVIVSGIINGLIPDVTQGSVTDLLGKTNPIAALGGGLAFLIVSIAILVALFRTWLILLGAFANIILAVIFAPVRLTLDAIPGQNQFTAWIKDLLANLLTFPLVTILLAIGAYIAGYQNPPEVVGFTPPLLGAGNVREVLPFVGLGILLTIPKALDILREAMKAPAFKYGGAWMESMTAGVQGGILTARYAPSVPGVKQAGNIIRRGSLRPISRVAGEVGADVPWGEPEKPKK